MSKSKLSASSLKNFLWISVEGKKGYATIDSWVLQLILLIYILIPMLTDQ